MSSSYYLAEIQKCEQKIRTCKSELQEEQEVLNGGLDVKQQYKNYLSKYEDEITMRRQKVNDVASLADRSVFAKRYYESIKDSFWGMSFQNNMNEIYGLQQDISSEVKKSENLVNEFKQRLLSLESELQSLKRKYNEALKREAEERAAQQNV